MNKFAKRRRYLVSMFYLTLNDKPMNDFISQQLLYDFLLERLIWDDIIDPEKFYGNDTNEYMDYLGR